MFDNVDFKWKLILNVYNFVTEKNCILTKYKYVTLNKQNTV